MRLQVVGCSPAWPNPGGAHSGYLVEGAGSALLDCGPGVLSRLRADVPWPAPDAIVLTHFHLDHWGDLVPWVWGASYLARRDDPPPRPRLWMPPAGAGRLETFGRELGSPDMFERTFELHEYADGEPFEAGGFTFTALGVPHYSLDAYGLRVGDGSRTLAYSGDSGPTERLSELARDADLFLCEATLADGAEDGQLRGHLSLDEALAAYGDSGAKRLLVTHRPAELPTPGDLELARDGLALEL